MNLPLFRSDRDEFDVVRKKVGFKDKKRSFIVLVCLIKLTKKMTCHGSVLLATAGALFAEERCPVWVDAIVHPIERTYDHYISSENRFVGVGLGLNVDTVDVIGGKKFFVPLGFRNPWPSEEIQERISNHELLDSGNDVTNLNSSGYADLGTLSDGNSPPFAFWMPNIRPVERNLRTTPHLRPCEPARPKPSNSEYVVKFKIIWPFVSGSEMASAAQRFRIARERLTNKGYLPQQKMGLWEHSLNGPISGLANYNIYDDDGDISVMLKCTELWGNKPAPNPLCSGHVWQRSQDLVLSVRFPSDRGQRGSKKLWNAPVLSAIRLAHFWKRKR